MTIVVCPLSKVADLVTAYRPERVVSLLDPGSAFPETGHARIGKHLRLSFYDAHPGELTPAAEHVAELLAFVRAWDRSAPILIHCRAGIGRSTAAAFATACLHNPHTSEHAIALALRTAASLARPNARLVALADAAMERAGRMSRAIAETGRDLSWVDVERALHEDGEGRAFELRSSF